MSNRPPIILVADDDLVSRTMLVQFLEESGYDVDIVENGAEAYDKALGKHYDAIVMDICMPVMDGWQATMKIKRYVKVPVIGVSGLDGASTIQNSTFWGMDTFVAKPVRKNEIIQAVQTQLSKVA